MTDFSRTDADRILRRAAELEGSDDGRRLTLEELRVIADEAGFTLEAVQHVCGDDLSSIEVIDLLDSLVGKSLVTVDRSEAAIRYGQLETIRQFGDEQLARTHGQDAVRRLLPHRLGLHRPCQEPDEVPRPAVRRSGVVVTHLSTVRHVPVEITSEQLLRAVRLFQPYRDGPARLNLEAREITWRDRRGIRFAVLSVDGLTEIRVHVARPLLRRGRWMGWVRAAADRLETLVEMVAREG